MRLMIAFFLCAAMAAVPMFGDSCMSASNLAANCGFETGDFAAWMLSGHDSAPGLNGIDYGVDAADARSGVYGAYLGGFGGVLDLSQMISTTAGDQYTISFWLAQSPAPVAPYLNSLNVEFGSATLLSISQVPNLAFTDYSFNAAATRPDTSLAFGFRDDLGYFSLDDVSVVPVPEPGFAGMLVALSRGCILACAAEALKAGTQALSSHPLAIGYRALSLANSRGRFL